MKTAIVDIEGTLIRGFTRISEKLHCVGVQDFDTKEYRVFTSRDNFTGFTDYMSNFNVIVAHNGIGYDFPNLKYHIKGYKELNLTEYDSLLFARILVPDVIRFDTHMYPKKLRGRHSLEAWGKRLKVHKKEYSGGFDVLTDEMVEYMKQDVIVLDKLWQYLQTLVYPSLKNTYKEDHKISEILAEIKEYGVTLDMRKLHELENTLTTDINKYTSQLKEVFQPIITAKTWEYTQTQNLPKYSKLSQKQKKNYGFHLFPPEDYNREFFAKEVFKHKEPRCNVKVEEFNPNSRDQIAMRLIQKGFKPIKFTEKGLVEISYETMKDIKHTFKEAEYIYNLMMLQKRFGYVCSDKEGSNSFKNKEINGKIYPNITHYGASATGRCSHSQPNLSQCPAVILKDKKPVKGFDGEYGWEIRELIIPSSDDRYIVGGDIGSLEAVLYGEFLYPYDNGSMLQIVSDPSKSIHDLNLNSIHRAGKRIANKRISEILLNTDRSGAKTVYYAISYGAGYTKIGHTISPNLTQDNKIKVGKLVKEELTKGIKGADRLLSNLENQVKNHGYITIFEGRRIKCDEPRIALNRLIQSSGAYVAKLWVIRTHELLTEAGIDARLIVFSHDEQQFEVRKGQEEQVKTIMKDAMKHVCDRLKLRTQLVIDCKHGNSWAETH